MDWRELADCQYTDPELFFTPEDRAVNQYWSKPAKRICSDCPVRVECLEAAIAEEATVERDYRYGIRGGLTGLERYQLTHPGLVNA